MTFGDVLYEFCAYRTRLKSFSMKRLQVRRIMRMLNFTSEVVRAVTMASDLPYVEEFYRKSNFKAFQKDTRMRLQNMVKVRIESHETTGKDFNAFILAHEKESNANKQAWQASSYLIKQLQLLHRMMFSNIRIHQKLLCFCRHKETRAALKEGLERAEKEYEMLMKLVLRH